MLERVEKCRSIFAQYDLDGFLITSAVNRRYLTGFTGTSGAVLLTEQDAVFITDFRYVQQAEEQINGFHIVRHSGPIEETIRDEVQRRRVKRLGFEQDRLTYGTYRKYAEVFSPTELVPVSGAIEQLRLVKDEQEIELIKKAVDIVDRTYEHILRMIKPGMKEKEVANELEFHMRKLGASSSSFDMIVASGTRSALPHGVASDKTIERGDFITLDFGAVYNGYMSDMTRTFALGEADDQLKEIYDVCLEAQRIGVENIRAGMTGQEADALCRDYITAKGYGKAFGHSTGHGIGLEIHEGPVLSSRSNVTLRPGMVVTVEPGIYLAGRGGVRIEDDVLITETGCEILTQSTKELLMV